MVEKLKFSFKGNDVFPLIDGLKLKDLLDFKHFGRLDISIRNKVFDIKKCDCGEDSSFLLVDIIGKNVNSVIVDISFLCKECVLGIKDR